MILEETYTLSNGIEIPELGLGTWFIDNANAASAVKEAAKIGYRHIGTAQAYKSIDPLDDYYDDAAPYWDGIVRIGQVEGDLSAVRQLPQAARVTIERAG